MKSVNDIRSTFLNYFAQQGHSAVPSASLVPQSDPTLMFTNAGMVPFKNMFTGAETLKDKQGKPIIRAASSQKCVRAGGKHNDLDNVGYTARHHTFFEMLGNFSFADYFKDDAIKFAWELLTKDFALPKEKLYVTVYHTDDEAANLWKKIAGLSDDRILRIATNDNFWSMGDTGPCGPCSEIFFDHGDHIPGGLPGTPEEDGDRYIEIWNLVFMQYEKHADGTQTNLPKPCIDTGMGLERISAVLQHVHDNYDIDLFANLIRASQEASSNNDKALHNSHRIIADHLRSSSFLLADGVNPSNEGRGYVLRRIMRRAMRHAHILGCKEPLMHRLVPELITQMGDAYPELARAKAHIVATLKQEEEKFKETLGRGLALLEEEMQGKQTLAGEVAFKLYDTYGFPVDLTQDILRGRNMALDVAGFDAAMAEQKKRARAAWAGSGASAMDTIWLELKDQFGGTEFLGYNNIVGSGKLLALVKNGAAVDVANVGDEIIFLTNQTPFYAESGGQAGDHGIAKTDNAELKITDTKKLAGALHAHVAKVTKGSVKNGESLQLIVDNQRRLALRANHSATHLLHAVLRNVLGAHVTQKGSLVEADYLRFDFSHQAALTAEEKQKIEAQVNALIRQNTEISTRLMTPDQAIEQGAMALFGEKYGEEVRVLSMGENDHGGNYSVELCGGTHAARTGDIGLFVITQESSVASGIRRIEATTAAGAYAYITAKQQQLNAAADVLKTSGEELPARITALQDERKKLERELTDVKKKLALGGGGSASNSDLPEQVNGVNFIGKILNDIAVKDLRGIVDDLKKQHGFAVIAIVSVTEGKVAVVVGVTDDLTTKYSAVDLVKAGSEALGGKGGGGRPDFAQAGGADASNPQAALDTVKAKLAEK